MADYAWRFLNSWAVRALCYPRTVDDYLDALQPLWSVDEIRARIHCIKRETADAASLYLQPNRNWHGHRAGQHVELTVEIEGVRHSRCFSLSSSPTDPLLRITIKRNGRVSRYIVERAQAGEHVVISPPRGSFVLPQPRPAKLLMISGGSGITPMLAMLRQLQAERYQGDIMLLHYDAHPQALIGHAELLELRKGLPGLRLQLCFTREGLGDSARFSAAQLETLVPDAADRAAFLCGPAGLMEAVRRHHLERPFRALSTEQFVLPALNVRGEGEVLFKRSGVVASGASAGSLLELAERSGLTPRYGCRTGICHTCKHRIIEGWVRDVRSGEVRRARDEDLQLCVHAAAGDVQLDL